MDPKGGVFSPDGRTVWIFSVRGRELAQAMPFDLEGQAGEPVALPSWNIIGISPAGDRFLWADRTGHAFSSPLKAGAATPQSWSLAQDEFSAGWDRPEEVLIRHPLDGTRERVDRLDLATGRRTPFETYVSKDPMGIIRVEDVELSLDRQTVGLTYARVVHSDLLLGEGLVPR